VRQIISSSGLQTFSAYLKAGTLNKASLRIDASTSIILDFDLSNGTFISSSGTFIGYKIISIGSGWYRISVSYNDSNTNVHIYPDRAGTTAGNILVQNAQLEASDIATDYIPTTSSAVSVGMTADVPRLDYLGSSCPSLLLEPQRTNLVLYSEQFDNAVWFNTEDTTVSANAGVSPDGYTNADKLIPQATSNLHRIAQGIVVTAATPYTYSIFVKKSGYDYFLIRVGDGLFNNVGYDLVNGTVTFAAIGYSGFIESYENDWFRLGFVRSFGGALATINMRPNNIIVNSNTIPAFTGDGTSGAFVWGAQLEEGSYPTSYIPTLGTSVTRVADGASKTGISSLIGQTEGTVFTELDVRIIVPTSSPRRPISLEAGTDVNSLIINFATTGAIQIVLGGVTMDTGLNVSSTNGVVKIAIAYSASGFVAFVNGILRDTYTGAWTQPTWSSIGVGGSVNTATREFGDRVAQALLFKTRLSNTELAQLTSI
jgi:hypothetical protein